MAEVSLLRFWTSPFCARVELALQLKGVSYEVIEENVELVHQHNPIFKEVPVLLHNGTPIIGSMTIVEYVDEEWGGRHAIMPKDPYEKAHARFIAKFIDDKCIPTLRNSFWSEGEMKKTNMELANANLTILEKELKGKKFFGGDSIGYLDIAAAYVAYWVSVFEEVSEVTVFKKENHPALWNWSLEFVNSEAANKCLPDRAKLVVFFDSIKANMKNHYVKPVV